MLKFYNQNKQLYLETDVSGVRLGVGLLQERGRIQFPKDEEHDNLVLWLIAFTSKSFTCAETGYSSIEREVLGMLYGL